MKGTIHVLTGPTAVGKTELALRWAEANGAEIVSCDALLFYRGMDIGTAKPTAAERAWVPHHLIDVRDAAMGMDVTEYVALAQAASADIAARGKRVLVAVILAGGVASSAVALHATLRARRRKQVEPGITAFVLGAALLGAAVLTGVALVFAPAGQPWMLRGVATYGLLLIPGALSLTVLGMLCKIVPFLVWMRAYGPKVGRQPVPVATALASRSLERGWLAFHLAGVGLLTAGWAMAGAVALAVATGLFLANMLRVLAHLRGGRGRPAACGGVPVSLS